MESQPRRSHNELISEYKEVRTFAEVAPEAVNSIQEWRKSGKPELQQQGIQIGKGFGLLSVIKMGGQG